MVTVCETVVQDEIDAALLPVFIAEADGLCPKIASALHALRENPLEMSNLQLLNRLLHTLKGSARMTGAMHIGAIVHRMEGQLGDKNLPLFWGALESDLARIADLLEALRAGRAAVDTALGAVQKADARIVPFGCMSERLYRLARQTARELNKRVNLELSGTDILLDRRMLESMTAPFEHLLRNAIAHGLEDETVRLQLGKKAIGEISLSLRQANDEIVFEFCDDGAGLDLAALRVKAIAAGMAADKALDDRQLAQLIFVSGISTAKEVTELVGRGIGMDVVRSEITALGGRIDVSSQAGQGTRFDIHLPVAPAHLVE